MAEVKNLFIKSKMNKDLDDRLLPSGEYRDGQNVMISRSEGADVGSLENILGNWNIQDFAVDPNNATLNAILNPSGFNVGGAGTIGPTTVLATGGSGTGLEVIISVDTSGNITITGTLDEGTGYQPGDIVSFDPAAVDPAWAGAPVFNSDAMTEDLIGPDFSVIGKYEDELNNKIYVFLTNYTDCSTSRLDNYSLDTAGSIPYITPGIVSIIACFDLNAMEYIQLVKGRFLNFSKNSPIIGVNLLENLLFWTDNRNQPRKINVQKALAYPVGSPNPYYTEEHQISVAKYYPFIAPRLWAEEDIGGVLYPQCQMKDKTEEFLPRNISQPVGAEYNNPTYDATFPGDPNFLKDKFARFSYRFKFDDNEYSIIAPFSQIAFIPEQDGFFMATLNDLGGLLFTNEQQAYRSTIVDFMENKVDSVKIFIDLPCPLNELADKFKVKEIDILYKESSSIATKVVETLQVTSNTSVVDTFVSYEYLSTVPITTLPEIQTTRVYDQVPLRALAQEVIGNRVVYGNFQTINSYPDYLDYKVGVSEKAVTSVGAAPLPETTRVEYPNHTLKQSRNYEVGIVLVDKYGRQSPVITTDPDLDTLSTVGGVDFKGSTIFYPYYNETGSAINPQPDILDWCGDSLKMLFNNSIGVPGVRDAGLYTERNPLGWYSYKIVVKQTEQEYYNVFLPGMLDGYPFYNTDQLPDSTAHIVLINDNINKVPRDLREVGPTQQTFSSSVRLSGRVENVATPQASPSTAPYNRQYYPGAKQDQMSSIGTMEDLKLGTAKYFNLSSCDVAQIFPAAGDYIFVKEFNEDITDRMSVTPLNTPIGLLPAEFPPEVYLEEYSENPAFDSTAVTGTNACRGRFKLYDAATGAPYVLPYQVDADDTLRITNPYFYSSSGNPLIGRVATENPIGSKMETSTFVVPEFSVYETEAVESNLDIFWETTTSGIISELNDAIAVGGDIEGFDEWSYTQLESYPIGSSVLLSDVQAVDSLSVVVPLTSLTLDNVTSYSSTGTPINRTAEFILVEPILGQWNIDTTALFYFGNTAATAQTENYEFTFTAVPTNPLLNTKTFTYPGGLSNVKPILTAPSFTAPGGGGILGQIYTDGNGANINDSRKNLNLAFSILTQVDSTNGSAVNYFSLSNTSSFLQKNVNFATTTPAGVYEITYQLVDCNGNGLVDIAEATITITEPLLSGGFVVGDAQSFTLWQGGLSCWCSTSGILNPSVSYLDWVGRNNGPISTGTDAFYWPIGSTAANGTGYQTMRSIPVNLNVPIVGGTTVLTDTGPRYRGYNPDSGIGAIDNNPCGAGDAAQKYFINYELPQLKSENKYHSITGLTGGTVMFTITQEYDAPSTINKEISTFQNVIIQHRTNSSSAWTEAVDIHGNTFKGMTWDFVGNYDWWGYKSIIFSSDAPTNTNVKFNRQDCITVPSGIIGVTNTVQGTNDGLGSNKDSGVYQDRVSPITGLTPALCTTWGKYSFPPQTFSEVWKKSTRSGADLIGTMALRNYSSSAPQFASVALAERTFVTDVPGEYRIFFDNLAQSLAVSDVSYDRLSQSPKEASEDINSVLNVKDFYDIDPAGPWFEYRVQNIGYTHAATAFKYSMQGTEWPSDWDGVNNGNNWPNVGTPLLLYSLEGSFRYVNKFYERTGTGIPADPYVYTEWNPSSTGWYAYTEPAIAPVGAAFPIGAERAFGPRKGVAPYNSGCWPIWAIRINLSGQRIEGPAPSSYESVQPGETPPWY